MSSNFYLQTLFAYTSESINFQVAVYAKFYRDCLKALKMYAEAYHALREVLPFLSQINVLYLDFLVTINGFASIVPWWLYLKGGPKDYGAYEA